MVTIEVKNDYMLGRQNENILYNKCIELEQENKQLKEKLDILQQENKQLKEQKKQAIFFIKNNMYEDYCYCGSEDKLLEILGDKERK